METKEREIRMFVRSDGSCPFEDSIRALRDRKTKVRIHRRIDRLRVGNFGDSRSVGAGLHELRIHHGPGWRLYFAPLGRETIVLLCTGTKRTQESDIARARAYLKELQHDADEKL